jgi:hypothetical protein
LFEQLGIRSKSFLDPAADINLDPRLVSPSNNLCYTRVGGGTGEYLPPLDHYYRTPRAHLPFSDWWNKPVVKDSACRLFCRREMVLNLAETHCQSNALRTWAK